MCSIQDYEILNQYVRIKFHFENRKHYKDVEHYPSKTTNSFSKYLDLHFLKRMDFNNVTIFFIWLFYTKKDKEHKSNQEFMYESKEFRLFRDSLKNYKKTLENDFQKVYNAKSITNLKTLMFKKQISPLTFYILVNTKYKMHKNEIIQSNVFKEIWVPIQKLMYFINLNKEYIKNYISRF